MGHFKKERETIRNKNVLFFNTYKGVYNSFKTRNINHNKKKTALSAPKMPSS